MATRLLFIICFSLSLSSFAQLYVENSAYVFVNDQIITVTDDINLNNTDSKIYLRNEAQLIQKNNVGNTGIGQLSVQQSGTVNQYTYNYWCSPIGNNSASSGNEDFRVELIDESTGLISSIDVSFTGAGGFDSSLSPLTIASPWLWTFIASDEYSDWSYVGDTGNILPGLGFTMKGVGTGATGSQLYDFRGKPNNGTISNTVSAPVAGDPQWTLVGNPYPSAIDSRDFIHDTQNQNSITGTLLYWEQQQGQSSHNTNTYIGGYATYTINAAGTVESFVPAVFSTYDDQGQEVGAFPGPGGIKTAERYIPIGQGFMVEGSVGSTGTVRTTNDMRVYETESGGNSFFFRTSGEAEYNTVAYDEDGFNVVPEDFRRFRINVAFNETLSRQLLMNFHNSATDGFDYGLEGRSPEGVDSDAYWILDDAPFVIQALQFDEALKIPLVVKADEQQSIRFKIVDVQNFADSQPIYIHDKENDIYVDLRAQDYDINIEEGTFTDRFEIVFIQEDTLSIVESTLDTLKVIQDNTNAQLTILNPNALSIKSVSLIDIAGKQLWNKVNIGSNNTYNYSTSDLSEGVYLASIRLENNATLTQKIIVSHK
ncbi:T9SS type A sorting domain-containing protein [Winogradskyella sp. 3972H.M.0a.05]|uniref:T9SS type A sorting domain-containing protein n=1 Tax=Winogradskyella sp. 3972H.M.0a.05 TaxID=2950277 RepID=UPI00339229A6